MLSESLSPLHLQVVYTYSQGLQWCAQVADGLAFLHAQSPRIIHRDVKLDNVLLSDGAPKLRWLDPHLQLVDALHS